MQRALLRDCIDPAGVPVLKALPETDPRRQFEAVAREWHVQTKKRWTRKYAVDTLASLKTHVFPKLGKHDIDKITVPEMLDVMREVEKPGAFDLAHRVRQRCSGIFLHGIASGLCISDPAGVVARALHPVIKSRQPAITSLKDARDMLVKVENALCYPITKLASRALALTSVRPGELRCME
jgi:integrase